MSSSMQSTRAKAKSPKKKLVNFMEAIAIIIEKNYFFKICYAAVPKLK